MEPRAALSPEDLPASMRGWVNVDTESGCWLWMRAKNNTGYGVLLYNGAVRTAHRVAYAHTRGVIRDGFVLDHLCRRPACVNPTHLEQVTHTENIRRGTQIKLSPDRVEAIRLIRSTLGWSYRRIAKMFFVTPQCIHYACTGQKWGSGADPADESAA